jgi:reductive dehalogenase
MTDNVSQGMDSHEQRVRGSSDSGTIPDGFIYRDQRKRYPWWIKSVDKVTTETDDSIAESPTDVVFSLLAKRIIKGSPKWVARNREALIEKIKNNVPGSHLRDVALLFASGTYFAGGATLDGRSFDGIERIAEIVSVQIHPPDELGVPRWEGTPEETSKMVGTAAIHLGAVQVGFTVMNPLWMTPNIRFDPNLEEIERMGRFVTAVPERFKYVITAIALVPPVASVHAPSHIGGAADRVGFEGRTIINERIKNFIKGLGYGAINLPGFDNPIPFAIMAGLGEMGRMNRLISPLYGGAVRLTAILTDLPLALDKPIDFGLQEFCKRCKKCAKACPVGAISFEDEPFWEPKGPWSVPGKRVWYEDCATCVTYLNGAIYCGACMAACCWTKENKTSLHTLMKITGSRAPWASGLMVSMDDLFGYGLKPETVREEWWDLDLPVNHHP